MEGFCCKCAEPGVIPGFKYLSSFYWAGERFSLQSAEVPKRELLAITHSAKYGLGAGLRHPHSVMTNVLITSNLENVLIAMRALNGTD